MSPKRTKNSFHRPGHFLQCRLEECEEWFAVCSDGDRTKRCAYCSSSCSQLANKKSKARYRHSFKGKQRQSVCSSRHRQKKMEQSSANDLTTLSNTNQGKKNILVNRQWNTKKEREQYFFCLITLPHWFALLLTLGWIYSNHSFETVWCCHFCHIAVLLTE